MAQKYGNAKADSDKFMLRLPEGMRSDIKQKAANNERSMNSEILYLLKKGIEQVGAQQ